MLCSSGEDFVFFTGDGEGAVGLAGEVPAVGDFAAHVVLLSLSDCWPVHSWVG